MQIKKGIKPEFVVIGKEGSTMDGPGFIQKLWEDANANFNEVAHLAKRDENNQLVGVWGAMSDLAHSFLPWENFSKGLYLAGIEARNDAEAPKGWTKWVIPGFEYLMVLVQENDTFSQMIEYLKANNIPLVGAVHEFTSPQTGENYLYFPIKKL